MTHQKKTICQGNSDLHWEFFVDVFFANVGVNPICSIHHKVNS